MILSSQAQRMYENNYIDDNYEGKKPGFETIVTKAAVQQALRKRRVELNQRSAEKSERTEISPELEATLFALISQIQNETSIEQMAPTSAGDICVLGDMTVRLQKGVDDLKNNLVYADLNEGISHLVTQVVKCYVYKQATAVLTSQEAPEGYEGDLLYAS